MAYRFADCILDPERRELRRTGRLCAMEPQVFDLLVYLVENRHRVVSRDDIFKAIWRGRIVSDAALSTRINAVRCAIGDNGSEQRLLGTWRRKGFRFTGDVRQELSKQIQANPVVHSGRSLALTLGEAPTVAVLPFAITSDDSKIRPFGESLTEAIVTALSRHRWFFVVSNSALNAARPPAAAAHIARSFGADYALEGSIRVAGRRLRIATRLVDAVNGRHIWAHCYEDGFADFFSAQSRIAGQIAASVAHELFAAETIRRKSGSRETPSLWRCLARALALINTRQRTQVDEAERLLKTAISIDPASAPAHSLLSFVKTLRVHLGWQLRSSALPAALQVANKALALDPDEPWGHLALGYATFYTQPGQAVENLEDALKLDPTLAMAHYLLALVSAYTGDCEQAFDHADSAEALAAQDLLMRGNTGAPDNVRATTCFVAGRYSDGVNFARHTIAQSPRQVPAYRQLVINGAAAGEHEQAALALQKLKRLAPETPRYIKDAATMWSRVQDSRNYADAFRLAGLELS